MPQQLNIQYQYPHVPPTTGIGEAFGEGLVEGARVRALKDEGQLRLKQLAQQASQFEQEQREKFQQFEVMKGLQMEQLETAREGRNYARETYERTKLDDQDIPIGQAVKGYPHLKEQIQGIAGKGGFIRQKTVLAMQEQWLQTQRETQMSKIQIMLDQQKLAGAFDDSINKEMANVMATVESLKGAPPPPPGIVPPTAQNPNPDYKGPAGSWKSKGILATRQPGPSEVIGWLMGNSGATTYEEDLAGYQKAVEGTVADNLKTLNSMLEPKFNVTTGRTEYDSPLHRVNKYIALQRQLAGTTTDVASGASRYIQDKLFRLRSMLPSELQKEVIVNASLYRGLTLQEDTKASIEKLKAAYGGAKADMTSLERYLYGANPVTDKDIRARMEQDLERAKGLLFDTAP